MFVRVLVMSSLLALLSCSKPTPAPAKATPSIPSSAVSEVTWPPLPTDGFVSGRAATNEDVKAGRAAFSLQSAGRVIGQPLPITVPQYAFHVSQSGVRTPGIIIQAEVGLGIPMLGIRTLADGTVLGALQWEFVLLGTSVPASPVPKPK